MYTREGQVEVTHPPAPIMKEPMQEEAAVAVMRLFLVLARHAVYPASVGSKLQPTLPGTVQSSKVQGPPESVRICGTQQQSVLSMGPC